MKIAIKNARLAFPTLWTPRKASDAPDAKAKFGATFILEPSNPVVEEIAKAIVEVAKAKWADKHAGILSKLKEDKRICFSRQPKANSNGEPYDGFVGMCWISASADVRPGVFDANRSPLTSADGRPYGGCYVNGSIELWAQDNKYGKRINATLRGVQFLRDGDAFAATRPAQADEFEDMSAGAGESSGSAVDL